MTRDDAREQIIKSGRQLIGTFLQPAKKKVNGEKTYICPECNNGSGETGDGLCINPRSKYGGGWKCFACGFSGNVIDLYMLDRGVDYNTAFTALAEALGIEVDPWTPGRTTAAEDFKEAPSFMGTGSADKRKGQETAREAQERPGEAAGEQEHAKAPKSGLEAPETDYTAYYTECRARLEDERAKSYLAGRGISIETARRYLLGFDPKADPAKSGYPAPRIIIPTSRSHYVGRAVDPKTAKEYQKMNVKGGTPAFFNQDAIYAQDAEAVFIVEGAFDALSVAEVGQQAAALNSTNNAGKLIDLLQAAQKAGTITPATFVICLDNDDAGKKACQVLRDGLHRLNLPFIVSDICPGGAKDPNEALTADRDAFTKAVAEAVRQAGARPDNVKDYISSFMAEDIARFKQERKTGFKDLDAKAGGLYGGLYVLAAISSLGKTTFAAQMADQLAANGNDVIFFSMEQSRLELVTKSISRQVALNFMQDEKGFFVNSLQIRKGYLPEHVLAASKQYAEQVGNRLSIVEGNFSCDVSFIGDYIRNYYRKTGERPVVIVDYLQILQPPTDAQKKSMTTKEAVDINVTELKRVSRELDIPVIAISSVNRANYLQPIDFESLKESGAIEYSCDVCWGLQLACLDEEVFSKEGNLKEKRERVKKAKLENPRKIELVCLKNRYGRSSYTCSFDYYQDRDLYTEAGTEQVGQAISAGTKRRLADLKKEAKQKKGGAG